MSSPAVDSPHLTPRLSHRYQTILHQMLQGFCLLDVLLDETGAAVDYRFLEVNPAFSRLTGLPDPVGRTVRELLPNAATYWLDLYGQVARTGQPQHAELVAPQVHHRWFEVYALPTGGAGSRQVAVLFADITDRKREQLNLAFLADISQELLRLTDLDEAFDTLSTKLAAHLGLSACNFVELVEDAQVGLVTPGWHRADVPDLRGRYRMADFVTPEMLRRCQAGEAIIIRDVFTDPLTDGPRYAALGVGSFVSMPLVRDGHWRFLLSVYRPEPHDWHPADVALLRELANRGWSRLERARAEQQLRESEEKYRAVFTSMNEGFSLLDVQFNDQGEADDVIVRAVNPAQERIDGVRAQVGQRVRTLLPAIELKWFQRYGQVARSGEPLHFEDWSAATGRWYEVKASRVGEAGSTLVAILYTDITARKQAQKADALHQRLAQQRQQVSAVVEGQEAERRRIAESLHNGIGQLLYAVKLQLDRLPPRPEEPARAQAMQLLDEAIRQTRATSHELTPELLMDFGLQVALETICRHYRGTPTRWACHVDLEQAPALPLALQLTVYRLVQGLAHNAARHARARHITLEVTARPTWLVVRVEDDGQGFDPAAVPEGLGLTSLRSRVALLEGTLRLESAPNQGTLVEVRLPLTLAAAGEP